MGDAEKGRLSEVSEIRKVGKEKFHNFQDKPINQSGQPIASQYISQTRKQPIHANIIRLNTFNSVDICHVQLAVTSSVCEVPVTEVFDSRFRSLHIRLTLHSTNTSKRCIVQRPI